MTPDDLAKSGTEHAHQRALFAWCAMVINQGVEAAFDEKCYAKNGLLYAKIHYPNRPPVRVLEELYAIPNGGERNKVVAAKLKAEGVKAGTPDIHFPVACGNYHSMYIEMKKLGGIVSNIQKERIARLSSHGNYVVVCYSWHEAADELLNYLKLGGYYE